MGSTRQFGRKRPHLPLTTIQKEPEKTQAYVNATYRAAQRIKTQRASQVSAGQPAQAKYQPA
jgi:hypothetical protein